MGFIIDKGWLRSYVGNDEVIEIPSGVKDIDQHVFMGLEKTKTIIIPYGVESISYESFYKCPNLESINIPSSVNIIQKDFFYKCPKLEVTFDEGTRFKNVMGKYIEEGHEEANRIVFHRSILTAYKKYSPIYHRALLEFFLHPEEYPEDLRKTNQKYCEKNRAEILKYLHQNDEYEKVIAFYENIDKESGIIDEKPDNDSSAANDNLEGFSPRIMAEPVSPEKAVDFQIKDGVLEKYTGSDETVSIPSGISEIGRDAFFRNEKIKKIIVPSDVKKINSEYSFHGSFRDCPELSEVIISEGVTDIGPGTFSNCVKLQSISLPMDLLSFSEKVFSDCINLKNIIIPPKIKLIGDSAFYNCRSFTEIIIPNGVISLGEKAFGNCKDLKSIHIPATVTEISVDTFCDCPNLEIDFDEKTRFKSLDFPYYYSVPQDIWENKIVKSLLYRTKINGIKSYKIDAAIRFILDADHYPADIKEGYVKFCMSNRQKIINQAGKEDQEKINAFFDEQDKVSGISSGKKKLNDNEKVLLLEKMADEGTFEAFREVFEKYKPFEFYPRVLEKACISGDIEKVKLLVEAGASFTSPYKNVLNDRYISRFNYELEEYYYPKKGTNLIWHPDLVKIISSQKSTPENVVNILLYLKKQNLINPQTVFLASILAKNEEVTKQLYENRFRVIPTNFQDCFKDYMRFFTDDFPVKDQEAIKAIADDFNRYDLNFYAINLPGSFLDDEDSAFFNPKLLNEYLIRNGGSLPFSADHIFDKCNRRNKFETIEFLIDSGLIVPYAEKYIDGDRFNSFYSQGGAKLKSIIDDDPKMLNLLLKKAHWPMTEALFSSMYEYAAEYKITAIKKWLEKNKVELLTWNEPDKNATLNESNCKLKDLDKDVYKFTTDIYEITSYSGKDTDVIIPARISNKAINSFKKAAFRNKKFKSVIIEEGITFINEEAFAQCKNLESVTLPESILRIGKDAFKGCERLQRVEIPSSVRAIDSGAFSDCSSLKEINIMPGTKFIGENAFSGCKNLQKIDIPGTVLYIGKGAFLDCDELKEITFHDGLRHVCSKAFSECVNLSDVKLPDSLKIIDDQAFPDSVSDDSSNPSEFRQQTDQRKMRKIAEIKQKLSDGNYTQHEPFDRIEGELYLRFEAKGLQYNNVYENVRQLKKGDTIQIIREPENKFNYNNFRLLTENGKDAGNMPAKLCNVLAPFYDNDEITFEDIKACHVDSSGIMMDIEMFCVPKLAEDDSSEHHGNDSIQDTAENLFTYANEQKDTILHYYGAEKNVRIPNGVKKISAAVFRDNLILENVVLPDGISVIGISAFEGCHNLKSINIPESVVVIEESAFRNCLRLRNITLPLGLKKVGKNIFNGCKNLLINGEKILIINNVLMAYTGNDAEVSIPNGVVSIEEDAFSNSNELSKITLPNSVVHIGRRAFSNCARLQEVILPDSIEIIENQAFLNCKSLINVTIPARFTVFIPEKYDPMEKQVFEGCLRSKLKLIVHENSMAMDYAEKNYIKTKKIKTKEKFQPVSSEENNRQEIMEKLIVLKNKLEDFHPSEYEFNYDYKKKDFMIRFESKGTLYGERTANIEFVTNGDPLFLVNESNTKPWNGLGSCYLVTAEYKNVGYCPEDLSRFLSPLFRNGDMVYYAEAGEVIPVSKRGPKDKKGILYVELHCSPNEKSGIAQNEVPQDSEVNKNIDTVDFTENTSISPLADDKDNIPEPEIVSEKNENMTGIQEVETAAPDVKTPEKASSEKRFLSLLMSSVIESMKERDNQQDAKTEENLSTANQNIAEITIEEKHIDNAESIDSDNTENIVISEKGKPVVEKREISDPGLADAIVRAFIKLEMLYPEHKVFALDSLDSGLRNKITDFYKRIGYASDSEMLQAYGFEFVSGEQVKSLRPAVIYTPDNEPEIIKPRIESMLQRLNEYYPDHMIPGKIENDHKKLSQSISGLYQWLGYQDATSLLKAYGFDYLFQTSAGGRPTENDYEQIIHALIEKYKTSAKPKNMADLMRDNPEIKGKLKSLQNNQYKILGTNAVEYLKKVGVIKSDRNAPQIAENSVPDLKSESGMIQPENAPVVDSPQVDNTSVNNIDNKEFNIQEDNSVPLSENLNDNLQESESETTNTEPDVVIDVPEHIANQDFIEEMPVRNVTVSDTIPVNEENDNKEDYPDESAVNEQETPSVEDISSPEINRDNIQAYDITKQSNHSSDGQLPVVIEAAKVSGEIIDNEENASNAENAQSDKEEMPMQATEQATSAVDQKTAWIQYQAYEVLSSGRASAYYFFDLRNEMNLGNYNWQSEEFLYFYMKYFPGMPIEQLHQLRTQAVPRLNEPNTCNAQYQIIMQDSFEHRYVMIAYAWFERAGSFITSAARAQSVFNACRAFFYPQEQQTVWQRLCYEDGLLTNN